MKYFIRFVSPIIAIFVIFCAVLIPTHVNAQDESEVDFSPRSAPVNDIGGCEGAAASSPVCQDLDSDTNPLFGADGILTRVANLFALITGIVSVFMVIIGGLRYTTSSGDPSKTASAKDTILYAAIGVAVASAAGLIAKFVLSRL